MLRVIISRLRGRSRLPVYEPADAGQGGLPCAANENLPILSSGKDPARALLRVRMILARLRQENARYGTLLSSAARRRDYEECRALERALVWRYFERR